MPAMRRLVLLCLAFVACSKKEPPPTAAAAAGDAATPSPAADASIDAARDARAADGGTLSPADRKTLLRELNRGRTLAKAKDWQGALAAFDKALALAPDDARVLSEVGWAALQANDLNRADAANKRGLANASEPKARAAILYNTGRVAEARDQKDAARRAYTESLSLRESAEVKKRLENVGGALASDPNEGLRCTKPLANVAALCACLAKHADDVMMLLDEKPACVETKVKMGDPRLFGIDWGAQGDSDSITGERVHLLAVREGKEVRVVADLGHDYEPGAFGVHNRTEPKGGEIRKIGSRSVAVVRAEQNDTDFNMAGLELCTMHAKHEVVCAVADAPGATKCTPPLALVVESACGVGVRPEEKDLDADTKEALREIEARAHQDKGKATWSLEENGAVEVRVVEGSRDLFQAGTLRPMRLF